MIDASCKDEVPVINEEGEVVAAGKTCSDERERTFVQADCECKKNSWLQRTRVWLVGVSLDIGIFVGALVLLCACSNIPSNSPLAVLLLPILLVLACVFVVFLLKSVPSWACESGWVFFVGQTLMFLFMLRYAFRLVPSFGWDWGGLILSASSYVLSGTVENGPYFARYPNNQFWLSVLITFFRVLKTLNPSATLEFFSSACVVLGTLFVHSSIALIRVIVSRLYGSRIAFIVWLACFAYPPFYCYAPFAYTDTPGLLLCSLLILCYLELRNRREKTSGRIDSMGLICALLLGLLAAVTIKVKVMVFILVIGMAVDCILNADNAREATVKGLAFAASLLISISLLGVYSNTYLSISAEDSDAYEFPSIHWVMMSLVYGGYNGPDVEYTMSFPTYQERVEADKQRLIERVKERGILGTIEFMTVTKAVRTWGGCCLGGDDYVGRKPTHPESIALRLLSHDGDLNRDIRPYFWLTHIIILVGVLLSFVADWLGLACRRLYFARISFIGVYLFFTIWECNPRYLFVFVPLLAISAVDGWLALCRISKSISVSDVA